MTEIAVAAALARTDTLFTDIVHSHIDVVYNYARYMVLDHDEADDIVQKTFLSLYGQLSKLDLERPIKPWLFKVVKNHCLDYFRSKRPVNFSDLPEGMSDAIPDNDVSIEAKLESKLFLEQFRGLVEGLPLPAREVLLLKYFEDFTFEQIGQHLDMPENTVKTQFYRAKQKLFLQLNNLKK